MQKWEYRIESAENGTYTKEQLNDLGAAGWELVAYVPVPGVFGGVVTSRMIFKRPRDETPQEFETRERRSREYLRKIIREGVVK